MQKSGEVFQSHPDGYYHDAGQLFWITNPYKSLGSINKKCT